MHGVLSYRCSVLFYSRSRSESWPHHGRTFSIYLCSLSFWLTLPRRVLSTSWCCPSRPCVAFLACVHLALLLALSLFPGNSFVSSWCDHSILASLLWRCLTVTSLLQLVKNPLIFFAVHETRRIFLSPFISKASIRVSSFFRESSFHSRTLLQATLALSLVVSSMKSVCCDFSIFSAVMPRSPATDVAWSTLSACLSVCWSQPWPYKNDWTNREAVSVVDSGGSKEPRIKWGPESTGKGTISGGGLFPTIEMHRLFKQQTLQHHGAADSSAGDSAPRPKRGFKMDASAAGMTNAEAIRPFVKTPWPLVQQPLKWKWGSMPTVVVAVKPATHGPILSADGRQCQQSWT